MIKFKKLHPEAIIPTRANEGDAGLDLYALEDVKIYPTATEIKGKVMIFKAEESKIGYCSYFPTIIGQAVIKTGIAAEIPKGYYGKVSSRSGLAFKHGIVAFDGTIDSGYRGEIGVLLFNTTDKPYQIRKGDKIAQLIIIPCLLDEPQEVEELSDGERGTDGFGSTGR